MTRAVIGLLSSMQMCKFFSHYGMRTLLVLYMVESLHFSDARAFGVNALLCGLVELGGLAGGLLADRYLGLKKSLCWGACFLAVGYPLIIFSGGLFLAIGLIVLGGSLFGGNIAALLGAAFKENDPERQKGFTTFYMWQNLGALIATPICSVVAKMWGFSWAFAVAALGMVVGVVLLWVKRHLLDGFDYVPPSQRGGSLIVVLSFALIALIGNLALLGQHVVLPLLPYMTAAIFVVVVTLLLKDRRLPRKVVRHMTVYLGALILFFAVEDQICSSLILFSERVARGSVFGWTLPGALIMTINPIVIVVCGTFIGKKRFGLLVPFAITALAFAALACFSLMGINVSIFGVMGVVVLISIAELMVGPVVASAASEVAAKGSSGKVMALVPIAFSLAFQLSGTIGKMMAVDDENTQLAIYGLGFLKIALLLFLGGVFLTIVMRRVKDATTRYVS